MLQYLSKLLLWPLYGNGVATLHLLALVKLKSRRFVKKHPHWDEIDNNSTSWTWNCYHDHILEMSWSLYIYWFRSTRNMGALSKDIHSKIKSEITPLSKLKISIMTTLWKCRGHSASISIGLIETWTLYQKISIL